MKRLAILAAILLAPSAAALHEPIAAKDKADDLIIVGTHDLAPDGGPAHVDILRYDGRMRGHDFLQRVWFGGPPLQGAHEVNVTLWFQHSDGPYDWAVSAVARNESVNATLFYGARQYPLVARHAVENETLSIWWNATVMERNVCLQPFIASWPGPAAPGEPDIEDVLFPVPPDCHVRNPRSAVNETEWKDAHSGPRFITTAPPTLPATSDPLPGDLETPLPVALAIGALLMGALRKTRERSRER